MVEYKKLKEIFKRYYLLEKVNEILGWDRQVMMPEGGFTMRKEQQIFLDDLSNEIVCSKEVKKLIDNCDISKLSDFEKRDFALMKNIMSHKTAIPKKLQQEFIKLGLETEQIWVKARESDNFNAFNKSFKKLVKIIREIAHIKSEVLGVSPYDALIDQYDEGRKEKDLDNLFSKLSDKLPSLIDKIIAQQKESVHFLDDYSVKLQEKLGLQVIKSFGVDNLWCRADEAVHPFSSSEPGDGRITTRYLKNDFISGLMAFIHEAGHAIYDNNRPLDTMLQPIGQFQGMALHESQSLFMEMQIGRSRAFCKFLAPQICDIFGLSNKICNEESLFNKMNFVKKSYIRVDADEVTYPLHVMMRYEIEKDLIYDKIQTDDLPDVWNDKLKTFFDLKAPKVSKGVLQDIHWGSGTFGYFPTYSLGAIYASQIAAKVKQLITNYEQLIAKGEFTEILNCIKDNIHKKAAVDTADNIVKDFCGEPLNADVFLNYIKDKYCD